MRTEFCKVKTIEEADALCPWACRIVTCEGGFMAFECCTDYKTWLAQL